MKNKKMIEFARIHRNNPTPAEAFFWKKVQKRNVAGYRFLRQYAISYSDIQNSVCFFIADFYCAKKKLLIEIDGDYHLNQLEFDKARDQILTDLGFHMLRFTNEEVLQNWETVEKEIRSFLATH